MLGEAGDIVEDLQRQLARRREDKSPNALGGQGNAVFGQMLQDRQAEGRRLAGTSLGDADQIVIVQEMGDGLRLDRRRRLVPGITQGTQKWLGEAEIHEG